MGDYKIETLVVGTMETNCYIVVDEKTRDAVVIDPGDNVTVILDGLHRMNARLRAILLTHGHFDHVLAVGDLRDYNIPVCIHKADAHLLTERDAFSAMIPHDPRPFDPADVLFEKEGQYTVGGLTFYLLHSPGHTKGSVCYQFGDNLFTGDTLFRGAVGTLQFGGNEQDMNRSLKMLCNLPGDYTVYPGHYGKTTLSDELDTNPFLQPYRRK